MKTTQCKKEHGSGNQERSDFVTGFCSASYFIWECGHLNFFFNDTRRLLVSGVFSQSLTLVFVKIVQLLPFTEEVTFVLHLHKTQTEKAGVSVDMAKQKKKKVSSIFIFNE